MLLLIPFLLVLSTTHGAENAENKTEISEKIQMKSNETETTTLPMKEMLNETNNIEMMRITKPSLKTELLEVTTTPVSKESSTKKTEFRPSPQIESYVEFQDYPISNKFSKQMSPKISYLPPPPTIKNNFNPAVVSSHGKFGATNFNFGGAKFGHGNTNINFDNAYSKYDNTHNKYDNLHGIFDKVPSKFDNFPTKFENTPPKFDSIQNKLPNSFENQPITFDNSPLSYDNSPSKFDGLATKFGSLNFNGLDTKFDTSGSKYDSSGPKFDSQSLNFDSQGSKFDSQGPKFGSNQNFDSSSPNFNGGGSSFNARGPNFNAGGTNFNAGGPNLKAGPNFNAPGINFETSVPKLDSPGPKFDSSGVNFDTSSIKFDSSSPQFDAPGTNFDPLKFNHPKPKYGPPSTSYGSPISNFDLPKAKFDPNENDFSTPSPISNTYLPPTNKKPQKAEEKQLLYVEKPVRFESDFPPLKYYERFNYGGVPQFVYPGSLEWFNKVMVPVKPVVEGSYPVVVSDMTKHPLPVSKPVILTEEKLKHYGMTPWKRAAKFLATIIPIGLLLSALTPNILTITPTNGTQYCRKLKGRSENQDEIHPPSEIFTQQGCEAKLLCETAVHDSEMDVETVKHLFWTFVSQNADEDQTSIDLEAVSKAIKNKSCEDIPCRNTTSIKPKDSNR